ncbi:tetraacyldisaccharide 4'-kinase [Povalibacter sp.]|uniref:tetraacyldisaccharide 4'-kinase n=1 Tax=Povalibacter sp. TaxID=1962978 RepID=UPI002F410102
MKADPFLQQVWYRGQARWLLVLLLPLSALFWLVVKLRRAAYRVGLLRSHTVGKPVLVIGNITVGGTGKTPFVIWLTEWLQARGIQVGIVLRGYGGRSTHWPRDVHADTSAEEVGDEAVLHASRTGAIVVAGPDRVAAATRAIERGAAIVLCDDGLQHYRLARDGEIAVMDSQRGLGNRWLLPAGPLREPASRLNTVDLIVSTQRSDAGRMASGGATSVTATARLADAIALRSGERRALSSFAGSPVHAVAGIGNPQAFFDGLRQAGLSVEGRALPDHAAFSRADIEFGDQAPVLMTEKDAVKCRDLADHRHWAVRLDIDVAEADLARVEALLERVMGASRRTG